MQRFNSYFREIPIGELLSNMNAVVQGSTFNYSDDGLKVTVIPPTDVVIKNTCTVGLQKSNRYSVDCPFTDSQNIPGYKVEVAMVDTSDGNKFVFYEANELNNLYWDNEDSSINSVDIQAYRFTKISDKSTVPAAAENTPVKKSARIRRAVIGKWYSWSGNTKNMKGGIPRNLQPEDIVTYIVANGTIRFKVKPEQVCWIKNPNSQRDNVINYYRIS